MKKKYRFWITSNRGTNQSEIREVDIFDYDEKQEAAEVKGWLENWCSQFGAWNHSDNVVRYGYEAIKEEKIV